MFTSNKKTKGITLAEVLFSAAIMALVVTGVLVVFVQAVDMSKRINYEYNATNIAKSRMERARSIKATNGFCFLSDLGEIDTAVNSSGASEATGNFKRTTAVTANYNGDSRLTLVNVSVVYKYKGEWKDGIAVEVATVFTNVEY